MRAVTAMAAILTLFSVTVASALDAFSSSESQAVVVHEKADELVLANVVNRRRIDADVVLPMRISLTQNAHALRNAETWLMAVSDPDSPQFGQHWMQEDVISAFQPAAESVQVVSEWLRSNGIEFTHSDNKQWIAFDISAAKAEELLQTQYFEQERHFSDTDRVSFEASSDYYKLPLAVSQHVDFIKPGVKSTELTGATPRSREFLKNFVRGINYNPSHQARLKVPDPLPSADDLSKCWNYVTPACIRALYNISLADTSLAVSRKNTLGIFEAFESTYFEGALDHFFTEFAPYIPNGTAPFYHRVDNATARPPIRYRDPLKDWKDVSGETMFDLDISLPIIYPQNVSLYVVRPSGHFLASIDRLLDTFDGSYCDKAQPDRNRGVVKCGVFKPNNVVSLSWATHEAHLPRPHLDRICTEFLKLGLQGTSVFFASGDNDPKNIHGESHANWVLNHLTGVNFVYKGRSSSRFCENPNGTGPQLFSPYFPASCPWVTAVGGTKLGEHQPVSSREVAAFHRSSNNSVDAASGGGFSLAFERPSYQRTAVWNYFQTSDPPWNYFHNGNIRNSTRGYNKGRYNRNGRGYPDVSSSAWPIATVEKRHNSLSFGTSASAPTWAAILNRIVEERIRAGKGPVGFINPTLYKNPGVMNDILEGKNGFCTADDGFVCAPGWDPLTGLGTPNYPKLLDLFMALP